MKVCLITTTATNIGDDLIRTGVERLLREVLVDGDIAFTTINKHAPWELYSRSAGWLVKNLPHGKRRATSVLRHLSQAARAKTPVTGSDLVVQAGTPVLWPGCSEAEWQAPLWDDVLQRDRSIPVLSLAGGSCFPWASKERTVQGDDRVAAEAIASRADVVTVRDEVAADIFRSAGGDPAVLPCAAIHAGGGQPGDPDSERVMLNVMPEGGHFLWGQKLDPARWLASVDQLVEELRPNREIIFVCHSEDELELAQRRWPRHEAVLPRTAPEYLATCRRMGYAVVNRMHAAVSLAGLGIPAVAIGTDTRLLMVARAGQGIRYMGETDGNSLIDDALHLSQNRLELRQELILLEQESFAAHADLLKRTSAIKAVNSR